MVIASSYQGPRPPCAMMILRPGKSTATSSKEMGLPTWNKQSFACLASRFPYGEKITIEKLTMIDKAEQYLLNLGYRQVRVRHHGDVARIELEPEDWGSFMDKGRREDVYQAFKKIGFTYIALDLKGYRTGSMNENLGL